MYLNLVQLAESFGVSEKVVEDWIHDEGLPCVPDRGRVLFDRALVAHWAAAHGLTGRAGFLAPLKGAFTNGLALAPMLRTGGIWRDVPVVGILSRLELIVASLPQVAQPVRTLLGQRLHEKGAINWAPVGHRVALPHFSARVSLGRDCGLVALLLLRESLPLPDSPPDHLPVTRLFFFIPPSPRAHLDILARLSRAIAQGPLPRLLQDGGTDEEFLNALRDTDRSGNGENNPQESK